MKKIFFTILLLPFLSFGYTVEEIKDRVRGAYLYYWDSSYNQVYHNYYGHYDSVVSAFRSNWLAVECSSSSLYVPNIDDVNYDRTNSYTSVNSARPVYDSQDKYYSLTTFDDLRVVFKFAQSLYASGYRGTGFSDFNQVTSSRARFNFNYLVACSDILSSTNTVFRQILLNHLSSIQTAVVSIDSGVSSLSPRLDSIRDINSQILSNSQEAVSSLGVQSSNLFQVAEGVSRLGDSVESFSPIWSFERLSNFVESASNPSYNGVSLNTDGISWDIDPSNHDLTTPRGVARYENIVDQYRRSFPYLNALFGASRILSPNSSGLSGLGDSINSTIIDVLGVSGSDSLGSKAGGRGIAGDVRTTKLEIQDWKSKALSQLNQWKQDLKEDLQAWKTSDEHGILNVRRDMEQYFSFTNNLSSWRQQTEILTNSLQNLTVGDSSSISNLIKKISDFMERTFGQNGQGGNVRITYPLRYQDTAEVNVHDQALDDIIGELHSFYNTMSNLLDGVFADFSNTFKGTNSVDWTPWFEKWDPYSDTVTNYYSEYNSSQPVADLAARFLSEGFDIDTYNDLPWFSRVEVLLAMIADTSTNAVDVADIEDDLNDLVDDFKDLGTNVVASSESVVGLFDYVKRTANRFKLVFGDRSAPVTDSGITLLASGHWIGNEPLVLKVDITVQNVLRLFFRCFWLLSALVVLWLVLSWSWQKVVAVLRWLWSMFDL